jgi:chaperonin cofactor prefoldin
MSVLATYEVFDMSEQEREQLIKKYNQLVWKKHKLQEHQEDLEEQINTINYQIADIDATLDNIKKILYSQGY